MPDIFRAMAGRTDMQVIEELHRYAVAVWHRSGQRPIDGEMLWKFLGTRVDSDKSAKIMILVERANILARVAGTTDLWIPRPKFDHTME